MTYKTRYGCDWPAEMSDPLIGMTIGKKWTQFRAQGIEFKDPWVPLLDAAKALIPDQYFKVPPWTEEHFHDWVMAEKGCITWGCASCGKSNDYGLLMLLDWITDPYDTVIRLGSTDKQSLKSRVPRRAQAQQAGPRGPGQVLEVGLCRPERRRG